MKRISIVADIKISGITSASLLHIGDSCYIRPRNRVFAVQRQIATFWSNEGDFDSFRIFSQPIPLPTIIPQVHKCVDNWGSVIQVGRVRILGISSSSVMQVGSNRMIDAESRVKNIRQFITGTPVTRVESHSKPE